MCAIAAQILTDSGATGGPGGIVGAVVQSPLAVPVCITFTEFGGLHPDRHLHHWKAWRVVQK